MKTKTTKCCPIKHIKVHKSDEYTKINYLLCHYEIGVVL